MAMQYDVNVFEKFRATAVTDITNLVVGKTYYTNHYPSKFTIIGFETYKEHDVRNGFKPKVYEEDIVGWIVIGDGQWDTLSTRDNNIGASYNPWLVFSSEEEASRCKEELKISFYSSDFDDYDY